MEEQKQEQKKGSMFNFILGIFFIFSFGFSLYNKGLEIINTLGFIFGLVKIYEETCSELIHIKNLQTNNPSKLKNVA
jgi:hypothetical protein